ncbi:MAG: hypothetical protein WDA27_05395 [Actinomycetota bacterium]
MRNGPMETRNIAMGLILSGFGVLALGWYGAARIDYVQGQVPYLISGGLGGIGLMGAGFTLLLVQESRRRRRDLSAHMDRLIETLERRSTTPADSPMLHRGPQIVAGTSVYHLPTCRLLEGRGELPELSLGDVSETGLTPCRVCRPTATLN